jgi:hypothetical protein
VFLVRKSTPLRLIFTTSKSFFNIRPFPYVTFYPYSYLSVTVHTWIGPGSQRHI